jgi:N-acetyl-alpha-D-glucosaminyl L-malate synthase BshA
MNIGIVCYPTFGGSGVVATELGKALAGKGHKIHFISYDQPVRLNVFTSNLFYHEVTVSNYPLFDYPPYELALANKIVEVAKYEKLDVLHVHYAVPHAAAAYMAQQILADENMRLPFITTLHGTDITLVGKDASFESAISFVINKSDAVTSVSESLKQDTYKYFKRVKRDIEVIPNFICPEDYVFPNSHETRKKYAGDDEKILMHVSNFRKVKRVEDVLRMFDIVRKKIPARLILIGDGPERSNIEKLCRELDTCSQITSLGKVSEPGSYLSIADLFILPSETESFGLAALEAMAAGVPVISTNTGGLPEINQQGYSGFLSDVGDVEDMGKNALYIIENPSIHAQFRHNALLQAQKFDIERVLPMYENLYGQVVKN